MCAAPSGELGNCVPKKECAIRGGLPGGPCANGFGVCCVCRFSILYIIDLNTNSRIFHSHDKLWWDDT